MNLLLHFAKKPYQPVDLELGEVNPITPSPQEEGTNESTRLFFKLTFNLNSTSIMKLGMSTLSLVTTHMH